MSNYLYNGYGYGGYGGYGTAMALVMLIPILVIAGGLALYFLFAKRQETPSQNPVVRWLHGALSFRTLFTEHLLRALYCIVVVAITVISITLLFENFFYAVLYFVIGNIVARIVFELTMLLMILCRNVQEINQKSGPLPKPQAPAAHVPPMPPQQAAPRPAVHMPPNPQQAPVRPVAPPTPAQAVTPPQAPPVQSVAAQPEVKSVLPPVPPTDAKPEPKDHE